jgi:uncharacterized protein
MNKPLSEAEFDKLESFLDRFQNEQAMNLEMVDGFFAALNCSPEMTPPSIYLKEIWGGGEISDEEAFKDEADFHDFMDLMMRFWNDVSRRLNEEEVFLPVLTEESLKEAKGNDWAKGFLRGIKIHQEDWAELFDDEENGGSLVAIMTLAHENDPDPKMRPYKKPVDPELREKLLLNLCAGVMRIYTYFEPHRRMSSETLRRNHTFQRDIPKIGRNEPCPCGSGRKFKKCCGNVNLN